MAPQRTRLFIGPDRSITDNAGRRMAVETPLAVDVLRTGRPLGMLEDKVFDDFKAVLRERLPDLPKDTCFAIRGSAVTGDGFDGIAKRYEKR